MTRENKMVTLRRDKTGEPTVWCDPEIADLVDALNTEDLATVASCSGHGYRPGSIALSDGRYLMVFGNMEHAAPAEAAFPLDINGRPSTRHRRAALSQPPAEPSGDAVTELLAMFDAATRDDGLTIFDHTPEEFGLHIMENHLAIVAALRKPDAAPAADVVGKIIGECNRQADAVAICGEKSVAYRQAWVDAARILPEALSQPTPKPSDDAVELLREAREHFQQIHDLTGNLAWKEDLRDISDRIDQILNGRG
ncbi:hypothetical protein [Qipengyuania sp. MTN3-11]|uniref:hypothetical protein n=1 Tax=Qipengyuania sp. MTN3-11 TaxID=3056557 RepID=UPI0036F34A83